MCNENLNMGVMDSPDMITVDGKEYYYHDESAVPFIVYGNENKIAYGVNSSMHTMIKFKMMSNLVKCIEEKNPESDRVKLREQITKLINGKINTEGRYWDLTNECNKIIFSFWRWKKHNPGDEDNIIQKISEQRNLDLSKCYYTSLSGLVPARGKGEDLAPYANFQQEELPQEYFDEMDRLKALHVKGDDESDAEFNNRRLNAFDLFKQEKEKKLAQKLKYADKEGSMTDAEYRWRTSMDENKLNELSPEDKKLDFLGNLQKMSHGKDFLFSPDSLVFNNNKLSANNGTPFIVYDNFGTVDTFVGKPGEKHFSIFFDLKEKLIFKYIYKNEGNDSANRWDQLKVVSKYGFLKSDEDKKFFTEHNILSNEIIKNAYLYDGRCWITKEKDIIFAFWNREKQSNSHFGPMAKLDAVRIICNKYNFDINRCYILSSRGDNKFIQASNANAYDLSDSMESQSELDKMKQQHINGEVVGSKEFIDSREEDWANKHKNDNGTTPTRAEWNHLTKMDEEKK